MDIEILITLALIVAGLIGITAVCCMLVLVGAYLGLLLGKYVGRIRSKIG